MAKILVVDDEILIAMNTKQILENNGHVVNTAVSGENVLALIEKDYVPDLILMDIDLGRGRMDGVETALKIYQQHEIPVVFHSGHVDQETISKTRSVTKYGYVHKTAMNEMYLLSSIDMALNLYNANKKLKDNEHKLMEAQKIAHIGNWEMDPGSGICKGSDEIYRILELKCREDCYFDIKKMIHPEDMHIFEEKITQILEDGNPWSIEHRIVCEDDTLKWVHNKAKAVRNSNGRVCSIVGTIQDITRRKKLELEKMREQNLIRFFFNNVRDFIYLKDRERKFIRASESICTFLDCSMEDVIGKADEDFFSEERARQLIQDDRHVIETGESIINQVERVMLSDNKEHSYLVTKMPLRDDEGNIVGLFGISREISEIAQDE